MTIWTVQQRANRAASYVHPGEVAAEPDDYHAALFAVQDAVDAAHAPERARISVLHLKLALARVAHRGEWTPEDDAELDALHEIMRTAHAEAEAEFRAQWALAHIEYK